MSDERRAFGHQYSWLPHKAEAKQDTKQCGDMVRDAFYEGANQHPTAEDAFTRWTKSESRKRMMAFVGEAQ